MYADHNATTPLDAEVAREMTRIATDIFGNPSSSYSEGRKAKDILTTAREVISECLGIEDPQEITFTSSATESNNTVLNSITGEGVRTRTILTTATEHASVLVTCEHLVKEISSVDVAFIPVDKYGLISYETFVESAEKSNPGIVCIIYANNETGTIQRTGVINKIYKWCRKNKVIFHLDVTQAIGKIPVKLAGICDTASFSAHKFNGPRGVGGLYVRKDIRDRVLPFIVGGKQEENRRAGTENVAGIHGMSLAMKKSFASLGDYHDRVKTYRNLIRKEMASKIDGMVVFGPPDDHLMLPNTLNFSIPNVNSRNFISILDENSISVNVGSACSKGKRSRVLEAMGVPEHLEAGVFRVSLGKTNTANECRMLVNVFYETWVRMGVSPVK